MPEVLFLRKKEPVSKYTVDIYSSTVYNKTIQ